LLPGTYVNVRTTGHTPVTLLGIVTDEPAEA
jgi:hypothetical protein